ncbi:MAG: hypothetical protein HYV65_01310 [Candidatus Spechtbacteria bacterium]|nr:hypothetical protein [Candidatus Spechtbacteria bacterium]
MEEKREPQIISEDIINLVIARLKTIPANVEISIGGDGSSFTISELIEKVEKQDDIGKKMIEMQMAYLRSLGKLPTKESQDAFAIN